MKKKIVMLMGLPASGESTWAKEQIKNGFKVVNKDLLREMLHNSDWNIDKDKFILKVRDLLIRQIVGEGFSVIVDDTNFSPRHEVNLRKIAEELGADFEVNDSFLNTSLNECLLRDSMRVKKVGEKVIRGMYDQYLKERNYIKQDDSLPHAIICDIDGCLSHMKGRSPFDWKRVGEDIIDKHVWRLLHNNKNGGHNIIVSGRDSVCRKETEKWLKENYVVYDHLFMRPEGNNEKDCIVKKRILEKDILPNYFVELVLDDRTQVVNMWRELGLKVWQVAPGDF